MALVLLAGSFLAAFLAIALRLGATRWREAFLWAALGWGGWLVLSSELLSLAGGVSAIGVGIAWSIVLAASAAAAHWTFRKAKVATLQHSGGDPMVLGVALAAGLVLALIGVTALASPPNTWDSMTYHLPRVMHWMQRSAVSAYPTHIDRQVLIGPFAELGILHLRLLDGSDSHANLVQWFALLGSAIGASAVAGELGASPRGQAVAALAVVTIPMAVLQASSTQTDAVASLWLICAALLSIRLSRSPAPGWPAELALGAAVGLSFLTKQTGFLFVAPFVLLAVLAVRAKPLRVVRTGALVAAAALALNLGQFGRTWRATGSAIPPDLGTTVESISLGATFSNLVRNTALHLGTPWPRVNRPLERGARGLLEGLGIDPDDPGTTIVGQSFALPGLSRHEDNAGNGLHLLLAIGALAVLAWRRLLVWPRLGGAALPWAYALALGGAALLMSVLLRWQPWSSRLQLPLFIAACPFVGLALGRARSPLWTAGLLAVLLASAAPWVLRNSARPLLGPVSVLTTDWSARYFANRPELWEPFEAVVDQLASRRCGEVGWISGPDSWEYPLWVLLEQRLGRRPSVWHMEVKNATAHLEEKDRPPLCAVVLADQGDVEEVRVDGRSYHRAFSTGHLQLLWP
ncbi:MAG: DUF2142 domain-containing protein [Myxococcales bacterium]|nr:DUF2142 domain-containing protein [Myxococcales bacterium]